MAKKKAKKTAKKAKPKVAKKKVSKPKEELGKEVGKVTHYFTNIGVGVIELTGALKQGDKIRIKGATTDFEQKVDSMQIEHEKVETAKKGQSIGMKVKDHVREHDTVYLI